MTNSNGDKTIMSIGMKILPWMADLICAFLCWWAAQVNMELKDMRRDLTSLREWRAEAAGNRWTSSDHTKYADEQNKRTQDILLKMSDMQQTWLRDIADIKITLASVPKKDDLPPMWFRDYVKSIEIKLDAHIEKGKP